jgi:mono/diheme cytochrome c family protein
MTRQVTVLILFAALIAAGILSASQEDDQRSVQTGVYSDKQAASGEELFTQACMACHQPAEFREGGYMAGWTGSTANDFLELVRTTMPEDNPGRLRRREYVDIIAYFFKMAGLPSGAEDMKPGDLKTILIEGPFGASADGPDN